MSHSPVGTPKFIIALGIVGFVACSSNGGDGTRAAGSSGGVTSTGPSAGSAGAGFVVANGGTASSTIGTSLPAGCTPEICDGIDNDCDGVVDNLDVNGDGVCDCLAIATLGVPGTSGRGDVFKSWLSARSNSGAVDLGDQVITPDLIAKYQVLVVQDIYNKGKGHAYSASEIQAIVDFVRSGNGIMTMTGFYSAYEVNNNVNPILAAFGMSYSNEGILYGGGSTVPVTQWVPHAITENVKAIGVDNGYEVLGAGTVIATGQGHQVGMVNTSGDGRIFVWGDEWITFNSEWVNHPDYQVERFWLNIIKWLSPPKKCQVALPPIIIN